jgi:hypothetical protein
MKTLIVITLLSLAPAGAMAGGISAADAGPKAAFDRLFAAQFGTNGAEEQGWVNTCKLRGIRCRSGG